jgi:hypothetical protein
VIIGGVPCISGGSVVVKYVQIRRLALRPKDLLVHVYPNSDIKRKLLDITMYVCICKTVNSFHVNFFGLGSKKDMDFFARVKC